MLKVSYKRIVSGLSVDQLWNMRLELERIEKIRNNIRKASLDEKDRTRFLSILNKSEWTQSTR